MLQVDNLTKSYGGIRSVNGISFELGENEVIGLLGENGAGKSTTMNMLTGCLTQTSGSIMFEGRDTSEFFEEYKAKIGYLPEIPPLYLDMTVQEQLYFVCGVKAIPRTERKREIERVCELTNITHMKNRLTRNLSKGYKQRVGLAQAMISSPCFLLLDEPMAGLDPRQITEMRELITSLGMTVIISSHILSEISAMCSRLLIMKQGTLIADSTNSEFMSSFGGENVLHLRVKGEHDVIASILACTDGIQTWQAGENCEDGCCDYTIILSGTADIREDVFYAFAKAELPILHLELKTPTLEDVFIELTS